jgi:transmembrane sensor
MIPSDSLALERLLDRYLTGEVTAEEEAQVSAWLLTHPDVRFGLDTLVGRLAEARAPNIEASLATLRRERFDRAVNDSATMVRSPNISRTPRVAQRTFTIHRNLVGWVAGIGAACAIVWGMHGPTPSTHGSAQTFRTRVAERSAVTLKDGTRVMLAPQTTMTVSGGFGDRTRTITLSGEANFEVKSSAGAPFIVRTGAVATRVLGTTFTVRHYATDDAVQVVVSSGKVEAKGDDASITVTSGNGAKITDSTATLARSGDMGTYTDWTKGRLVFERATVPAMLATLGRWYGYDFRLADTTIATERVSAAFNVADAQEMLVILKGVLGVDLRFEERTVTLVARRDAKKAPQHRSPAFKPSLEMGK